jgi:hypothetical protein
LSLAATDDEKTCETCKQADFLSGEREEFIHFY